MKHVGETERTVLTNLQRWVEARDYAGYEPYDILNARRLPSLLRKNPIEWFLIQATKRFPGNAIRNLLDVKPSKNPKALALFLSGYCDLARSGQDFTERGLYLKKELTRLRSPDQEYFCWGYDWDYVSLRGSSMRAFRPNSIASVFCGQALLDMDEVYNDDEALEMAKSVGEWFVRKLNRPVDNDTQLCFSYTPENNTRVYNTSALVGAFLARLDARTGRAEYRELARRVMKYLADEQHADGSWSYGAEPRQQWVDNFHTGYNLFALREYEHLTADRSFHDILQRGYNFYSRTMFTQGGGPKYFSAGIYPFDIHSCAEALIIFSDFSDMFEGARKQAKTVLQWTIKNMLSEHGSFYYQKHRTWTNRQAYMRWGQAWMFHALTHFHVKFAGSGAEVP